MNFPSDFRLPYSFIATIANSIKIKSVLQVGVVHFVRERYKIESDLKYKSCGKFPCSIMILSSKPKSDDLRC